MSVKGFISQSVFTSSLNAVDNCEIRSAFSDYALIFMPKNTKTADVKRPYSHNMVPHIFRFFLIS